MVKIKGYKMISQTELKQRKPGIVSQDLIKQYLKQRQHIVKRKTYTCTRYNKTAVYTYMYLAIQASNTSRINWQECREKDIIVTRNSKFLLKL